MIYRWIFVALGLALMTGCESNSATNPAANSTALITVTGQYTFVGNPCTTEPCLPGMAYAIQTNDGLYFITIDDHWFSENRAWDGYLPEVGDFVTATGYLEQKLDIFQKPYSTLETVLIQPAK